MTKTKRPVNGNAIRDSGARSANVGSGAATLPSLQASASSLPAVRSSRLPRKDFLYVENAINVPDSLESNHHNPLVPFIMEIGLHRDNYHRLLRVAQNSPEVFLRRFVADFVAVGANFLGQKKKARGKNVGLETALHTRREIARQLYDFFKAAIDNKVEPKFYRKVLANVRKSASEAVRELGEPSSVPDPVALTFFCTERVLENMGYSPSALNVYSFTKQHEKANLEPFYKHVILKTKGTKFPKDLTARDLDAIADQPPYRGIFGQLFPPRRARP